MVVADIGVADVESRANVRRPATDASPNRVVPGARMAVWHEDSLRPVGQPTAVVRLSTVNRVVRLMGRG